MGRAAPWRPDCCRCAGYVLALYCLCTPRNTWEFLGVHSQYSRSNERESRRYVWATSLPTTRERIDETEHLASVMLTKATVLQGFTRILRAKHRLGSFSCSSLSSARFFGVEKHGSGCLCFKPAGSHAWLKKQQSQAKEIINYCEARPTGFSAPRERNAARSARSPVKRRDVQQRFGWKSTAWGVGRRVGGWRIGPV